MTIRLYPHWTGHYNCKRVRWWFERTPDKRGYYFGFVIHRLDFACIVKC